MKFYGEVGEYRNDGSCWQIGMLRSAYFLCCGRVEGPEDGLPRPDCWDIGIARSSKADCCRRETRIAALDARARSAKAAQGESPCARAPKQVWDFVEATAERLLWEGKLFADTKDEEFLLTNPDAAYEACPPALLLAAFARQARLVVEGDQEEADMWLDMQLVWGALRWSAPLAWENLQDPLVRAALQTAVLQLKVVIGIKERPAQVCARFTNRLFEHFTLAAGSSFTASTDGGQNLQGYPVLYQTALVITASGALLEDTPECLPTRMLSHVFTAKRLLDLKPRLAAAHLETLNVLATKIVAYEDLSSGDWVGLYHYLRNCLEVHQDWLMKAFAADPPVPPVPFPETKLGPLSLWEPGLAPWFSEAVKDPVLERLLGLIGVESRYYVEVGTQSGDQCNTRYLRVRYGFTGLMLDDNFQHEGLNQHRHLVTPGNVVELFERYGVPTNFALLSLDTDGYEWLLWLKILGAGFRPRVVVLEYSEALPYAEDLLVRYTSFPIHRLCLATHQRTPWLAGASLTAVMKLGNSWGYRLIHLVNGGTTDLIFVREDLLKEKRLDFPGQDNPSALCSLAEHQAGRRGAGCELAWPQNKTPHEELFTTSAQALAGDYEMPARWNNPEVLASTFC